MKIAPFAVHLSPTQFGTAAAGSLWPVFKSVLGRWGSGLARILLLQVLTALAIGSGGAWATTSINHQFSPSVINQGDTSLYTITITNDTITALTAAQATIFLDNTAGSPNVAGGHITIASGTVVSNTCGFTGVTATAADTKIILTGGTIAAGAVGMPAQCTFSLTVTSTVPGTYHAVFPAFSAPSSSVTGYVATEGALQVQNGTAADITLQVSALSAPTGAKSYSPSPAIAGDPTTLTITLTNPNVGATMPLTSFVDSLPSGMQVASTPAATINCSGTGAIDGTFVPSAGDTTLTLTGGTIGQGGTCVLAVKVIVPTVTATSQVLNNSLGAGAIGNTRGLSNPAFNTNLTVNSPIGVSKSFNPTITPAGQPSLMTLTISNNSTTTTLPVTSFLDDFSASTMTILDVAHGAPTGPTVTCSGTGGVPGSLSDSANAALASGSTSIKWVGATVAKSNTCVITAYVTSTLDGGHTNSVASDAVVNPVGHHSPSANASLTVNGQLTVDKTVTLSSVAPGQWTQFTVTIKNWSGGQIDNVLFSDALPLVNASNPAIGGQMVLQGVNPVTNVGCNGGAWTGADGDAALTWSGGSIAAGSGATPGSCTIVFKARLPDTATADVVFTNEIPKDGVSGICNGVGCSVGNGISVGNPAASPAVNVTTADSVAMTKGFSPSTIAQGGLSTMTLRIRNRTLSGLTAVNLTDSFPAGLTLASNPAATTSGCGGGATLEAFPGNNQLKLISGAIATRPDSSTQTDCTITAQVTSTTLGGAPSNQNTIATTDLSTSAGTIAAPVSATLTVATGLTGTKSFSPSSVTPGGTSRVTITITNSSNGDLTNVGINDPLGSNLTVANPANAATSCAGSPTQVVNPGATSAQLLGATLMSGASCDFSFDVLTSGDPANWSNTVPVGGISSAEGVFNSAPVGATLTKATGAININKSFNPVIVTGGVPSTLTLILSNPTASALHGVGFTDVFPNGIQVYSVPDVTSTCTGGTVTAVSGDGKMSLAGASMAANGSCTVTLQVTSVKFLNLTNVIPAGAVDSTEGYTNPSAVSATLTTLQGLGVMKAFSPAYVVPNAVTRLKMQLVSTYDANAPTPLTLTGVSYTDTLPVGVLVSPTPNATTTCVGPDGSGVATVTANAASSLVVLSGATIAPGSSCNIEVNVVAPSTLGTYTNLIPADSINTDQGPTNSNPATAKLYVVALPTLAKTFSPTTVSVGVDSTLMVTINNGAGVALTGVSLTDSLPSGVTIAGTPAATTTCSNASVTANPGTGVLAISGATVPAGGSCFFQAAVSSLTAGSYVNNVAVGALISNEGLTNPGAVNATLLVRSTPTVTKAFVPVLIDRSSTGLVKTSTLTIALGNSNASDVTLNSDFVDALPGNVVVATPSVKGGTCAGTVAAQAGANSITYASGASIPTGGCTITVQVSSDVVGTYTNAIAAGQLDTSAGKNQDPAFASLAVGAGALVPPTISKTFSPGTIDVNGTSTLTITLGNANASNRTLIADLVDTLPVNVVVSATPAIGGTCTSGNVTANVGASTITYANNATIPVAGCTITVKVTSATPGSYTNTIETGALQTNGGNNAQPTAAGLVVASQIPPTVTKAFSPNTINPEVPRA